MKILLDSVILIVKAERSKTMSEEKYFSVTEVARMYNVGRVTVGSWIRQGRLKAVRLGNVWRISETALAEFIKTNQQPPK
ncbi:MAG: helix-turn-helix domain-containing protein [Candidatus Methanomethyliaceae archaeon]